jgi:hypothetical protein
MKSFFERRGKQNHVQRAWHTRTRSAQQRTDDKQNKRRASKSRCFYQTLRESGKRRAVRMTGICCLGRGRFYCPMNARNRKGELDYCFHVYKILGYKHCKGKGRMRCSASRNPPKLEFGGFPRGGRRVSGRFKTAISNLVLFRSPLPHFLPELGLVLNSAICVSRYPTPLLLRMEFGFEVGGGTSQVGGGYFAGGGYFGRARPPYHRSI